MKKVSQMFAERKERKRLEKVNYLGPYLAHNLKNSQAETILLVPGEDTCPTLTGPELNMIGSFLEDRGYTTIAMNLGLTEEESQIFFAVVGMNITVTWESYKAAAKVTIDDEETDQELRDGMMVAIPIQHKILQERYKVQLEPF